MKKALLAAALALAPIPAHAIGYQIINGMPTFGERPKALDIFNLDWEFANDPEWGSEVFDCALMPYVLGQFVIWETTYHPPGPPPNDPPPVDPPPCADCDPPPPCVNCGPPIVAPIPEPSTWIMLLAGLSAIGFLKWRRA